MEREKLLKGNDIDSKINIIKKYLDDLCHPSFDDMYRCRLTLSTNFSTRLKKTFLDDDEEDVDLLLIIKEMIKSYYTNKLNKLEKEFSEL